MAVLGYVGLALIGIALLGVIVAGLPQRHTRRGPLADEREQAIREFHNRMEQKRADRARSNTTVSHLRRGA